MKTVRKLGTALLCGIMSLGCIIVIITVFAYALRLMGYSNKAINWFTQNASVSLDWIGEFKNPDNINKYAKKKTSSEKCNDIIIGIEDTIEDFCTSAFPGNATIHNVVDAYKKNIMHYELSAELGKKTNKELADEAATYVENFAYWSKEQGIEFLYVNLPCGTRIKMANGSKNVQSEALELPNAFTDAVKERNIPFLNIDDNEELLKGFSLDASGHWMPVDALKATSIVSEHLNKSYGLKFDLSLFDETNYKNALELNSDAQSTIYNDFGYEYQFLIPIDSPEYIVDVNELEIKEGYFIDTLLTDIGNWDRRVNDNTAIAYHDMWTINNGSYVKIQNTSGTNNDGTKILVLGDSFSWPITSYLSEDIEYIVSFNPGFFPGYVKNYIQAYQPDIILWIYVENQVGSENDSAFGKVE